MTRRYTEEEVIERVASLTRTQLVSFVRAEVIRPVLTRDGGAYYRQVDLARLELLCELCDVFGLQDDALAMVISLIDQLHAARRELRLVLDVVAEHGSDSLRLRVGEALRQANRG